MNTLKKSVNIKQIFLNHTKHDMTTNIFLQARINSTRFPKKILKKICDKSIIELIIERVKMIKNIDKIVLVTGPRNLNHELIKIVESTGIKYFCGSEENVLDRFYKASLEFDSDNILRITCDNPVIDFNIINKALTIFLSHNYDLLYLDDNSLYPKGLNFEIFSSNALKETWNQLYEQFNDKTKFNYTFFSPGSCLLNNEQLTKFHFISIKRYPNIRLTMDYEADFFLIRSIYNHIYLNNQLFTLEDMIDLFSKKPELIKMNEKYRQPKDNHIN